MSDDSVFDSVTFHWPSTDQFNHNHLEWYRYYHTTSVNALQLLTIILGSETGTYATDCPAHSSVKYNSRHVHMDLEKKTLSV